MQTAAPRGGGEGDCRTTGHDTSTTSAAAVQVDLPALRARLVGARRRLVERIADDFPADRRFPDTGWSRLLADIQLVIAAVDDVMDEAGQ